MLSNQTLLYKSKCFRVVIIFSSVLASVLGTQKNHLNETHSTHNINWISIMHIYLEVFLKTTTLTLCILMDSSIWFDTINLW